MNKNMLVSTAITVRVGTVERFKDTDIYKRDVMDNFENVRKLYHDALDKMLDEIIEIKDGLGLEFIID